MPSTENHGSSSSFASFGRSIWSIGREQVHSVEPVQNSSSGEEVELQAFEKDVLNRFRNLSHASDDELLSLGWIQKLLDAFISCQEDFRLLLLNNRSLVSKQPLDHVVSDYFEMSVKALDICNAARDGIERLRQWGKLVEIVLSALASCKKTTTANTVSEGQFRRARKALMELAIAMLDEKDSGSMFSCRNRSFGRHKNVNSSSKDHHRRHSQPGHSRSLSWSVSHTWSATKQLQSIASSLVPPHKNDIMATSGLAIPVFIMRCVLMFTCWALVAAIPCQDRSLQCQYTIPRHFSWGAPLLSLHERILEESKKRGRRNSNGLLLEIYHIEKSSQHLMDLVDTAEFPLGDERRTELEQAVEGLALVCGVIKSGLDPLERQIRLVFRKVMNCRIEGLEFLTGVNSDPS